MPNQVKSDVCWCVSYGCRIVTQLPDIRCFIYVFPESTSPVAIICWLFCVFKLILSTTLSKEKNVETLSSRKVQSKSYIYMFRRWINFRQCYTQNHSFERRSTIASSSFTGGCLIQSFPITPNSHACIACTSLRGVARLSNHISITDIQSAFIWLYVYTQ